MWMLSYKKPLFWFIISIISGLIAVTSFIVYLKFTKVFILGYVYVIFSTVALILGVIAVVKIARNWKTRKVYAIVELLVLLLAGYILFEITLFSYFRCRTRNSITFNAVYRMKYLSDAINEYALKNSHMPDADDWCNSLIGYPLAGSLRVTKSCFYIIGNPDIECNYAFNENLDGLPLDEIKDNVVLLFEADGKLNLTGGPELISKKRIKDKYFFSKQRFIYILFVDGMIVKYRLHDGAVALYEPSKGKFTDYRKKSETPYSPLKWK